MADLASTHQLEQDLRGELSERLMCEYEIDGDTMHVYDIVWGHEDFNHPIFAELAQTDALRRLMTVEQLTLPDRYKTIPGSAHFSRWEHAWGSAIFARRIGQEMGLGEDEIVKMQLKALLSDVCHTAHSHAGDWIFEGVGKNEKLHDARRQNYAEVVGISEILRRKNFNPDEILTEHKDGIIDSEMPKLDVDRVDYTMREAYRWVNQIPEFKEILNKDSFTVVDGQIVVNNRQAAQLLGVAYVLLVTEHWQEPSHRLQLELFMESIKRLFISRHDGRNEIGTYSPLDLMMVTDDTLQRLSDEHDDYMPLLNGLMREVSASETTHRWQARADRVRVALTNSLHGAGESIEWIKASYDALPRPFEITPKEGSKLRSSKYAHVLNLQKLRTRFIEPQFLEDGEVKSLGEDEAFMTFKDETLATVQQDWRAAIIGNEVSTTALRECLKINKREWPAVARREPMPNSVFKAQLRDTVARSNGAAAGFIKFSIK